MSTGCREMERAARDFEAGTRMLQTLFAEAGDPCEFTDRLRLLAADPTAETCTIDVAGQHFEVGVNAANADYVRQVASVLLALAETADPTGLELIRTDPEEAP